MNKHKRRVTILAMLSMLFFSPTVRAQTTEGMTLQECLEYSQENHALNQAAEYEEKISEFQNKEVISSYLPQITGTGTLDDNLKRMTTVIPGGTFGPEDTEVQFGNQYTTNLYVQVDQTLYNQAMIQGIKAMDSNLELARLKKMQQAEDISFSTAVAYYNAMIQKEQLRLLAENEEKITELLRIQTAKLEKGLIQSLDVKRLQVSYNNIIAQKETGEMNYELAVNRLKNAMGMPLDTAIQLRDSLDYNTFQVGGYETTPTIQNTLDYQMQETNIHLQELNYKRTQASVFPTLSAYGRYGAQTFDNNFADQYDNFYDYSVIGLRLNVPIFSSLKYHNQIKQSEFQLLSTKEQFNYNKQALEFNVINAYTALVTIQKNLETTTDNLELAKEVFDNTNAQYQKGLASLSDLLNTEFSYKEAQSNYISTLLNYVIKRLELEKAQGTLITYLEKL